MIMKRTLFVILSAVCFSLLPTGAFPASEAPRWIGFPGGAADTENSWTAFRRDVRLDVVPLSAVARIAVDSKYWLWINGEPVVREGGLKRGPTPADSYCDEVDLAPYLKKGVNRVAVLVWHFGKEGFSHKSSGRSGLFFELPGVVVSDSAWSCRLHPAFGTCGGPFPNSRLAESNIRFDARLDLGPWQTALCDAAGFVRAEESGAEGAAPWGALVPRPIPQWKDFGVRRAKFVRRAGDGCDTLVARLPYNMQFTPVVALTDASGGRTVGLLTDHTVAGGDVNLRAEYVTRPGRQRYESPGWLSGEELWAVVPHGVEVHEIAYRESGYDTEPSGRFSCDDAFVMRFWQKALRTLYVNMRDTFFDCPDRERAQWWGDVTVMMGELFYTYSPSVHALMRKAMLELAAWQKPDGALFSPIPAGNYDAELPGQMLAAVGRYGFWTYYLHTGDRATIERVYPAVRRYLALWTTDSTGLTELRRGGWNWGDWGDERDMRLIYAGWHALALEGAANMAELLGRDDEAAGYRAERERVAAGYERCWNGTAYRHPDYTGATDDRVQALAVVAGIAGPERYDALFATLRTQEYASPYMEKYVLEALFRMGHGDYALERFRRRFAPMVDDPERTTLFEGWDIGNAKYGGGTTNHAWSGGPLTVIAGQICGIRPLEAGYRSFAVAPACALLPRAAISVPTVAGDIRVSWRPGKRGRELRLTVPEGTTACVPLPDTVSHLRVDGRRCAAAACELSPGLREIRLPAGRHTVHLFSEPCN